MKLKELFSILPNLELLHIKEDFATDPAITIPDFNPRYSKIVGTYDGKDVWGSRFFGPDHDAYGFADKDQVLAFVVIGSDKNAKYDAYPIERIWTDPSQHGKGYATALILFLTQKLKVKLLIDKNEKLTQDSWDWLIKGVEKKRLNAIDVKTNKIVKLTKLKKELKQKQLTSTALIIESTSTLATLFGTGYRILKEMPSIISENSYYE